MVASGLGLSICAHLVRLMGGGIAVESAPGKGSTFRFSVRMGVGTRPDDVVPLVPPDALRDRPVLIVDDSPVAREVLGELLAGWGVAVTTVDGARVGFVTLKRAQDDGTPFAAVVVDAHMPGTDGFAFVDAVRREEGLTLPPVLMLTREGEPRDAARCRVLDVAGLVTKPIREAELLDAVSAVLGCPRPGGDDRDARGRRRMTRPQHCLVVEDNDYNQLLIVRLLENHGHSAVVAADGREALAALGKERFDVILMDVEMPDMDGFEATARIQARFADGDCPPIIAITAHALKGDRERCLAAGMDAYLSKPLRASELFATMERLAGEGPAPAPVDEGDTPPSRHRRPPRSRRREHQARTRAGRAPARASPRHGRGRPRRGRAGRRARPRARRPLVEGRIPAVVSRQRRRHGATPRGHGPSRHRRRRRRPLHGARGRGRASRSRTGPARAGVASVLAWRVVRRSGSCPPRSRSHPEGWPSG